MEKKLFNENLSCYILRSTAIIFKNAKNNWISQVISKMSNDERIILYNKENKYNNCLHLSDLKKIILKIKNKKKREKKIYNISSNKPIKIIEIKNIIKQNSCIKVEGFLIFLLSSTNLFEFGKYQTCIKNSGKKGRMVKSSSLLGKKPLHLIFSLMK